MVGSGWGGQGGFEQRIEVFCENSRGGRGGGGGQVGGRVGWWGGQVDVNVELKFLGKFKKKFFWGGGVRGGRVIWGGGRDQGGDQGGCE